MNRKMDKDNNSTIAIVKESIDCCMDRLKEGKELLKESDDVTVAYKIRMNELSEELSSLVSVIKLATGLL